MKQLFIIAFAICLMACEKEEVNPESEIAEYRYEFSNRTQYYIGYIEQYTGNRINKASLFGTFIVKWQQEGIKPQYACSGASYMDGASTIKLYRNDVLLKSVTGTTTGMAELKGDY